MQGPEERSVWPRPGMTPQRRISVLGSDQENPLSLIEQISGLQIDRSLRYKTKPEPGRNGQPISLLANSFLLRFGFKSSVFIHHYDVTIDQSGETAFLSEAIGELPGTETRSRKLVQKFNMQIIEKMVQENSDEGGIFSGVHPVFDGQRNLYVKTELDAESENAIQFEDGVRFRFEVSTKEFNNDSESVFIIWLKHVAKIEVNPEWSAFSQEAIQFIDIVLRYGPTREKIPVGCKIFFPSPHRRQVLSMNKELAFGFYQSARNSEVGLILNVDRAASVFHTGGSMLTVLKDCIPGVEKFARIPDEFIRQLSIELRGMRFLATHLSYPKRYRIYELTLQPACELKFSMNVRNENGDIIRVVEMTVADYYKQTYGKKLRLPHLPCLVTGSKKNPKYFPLEICELIKDQYVTRKLHANVMAQMTQLASSQRPNDRFNEITQSLNQAIRSDGQVYNNEFGINISPQVIQVNGRVLQSPSLKFGNDQQFQPNQECIWMMQKPSEKHFFEGVQIDKWIMVNMSRGNMIPDDLLPRFSTRLQETAQTLGMQMSEHLKLVRYNYIDTISLKNNVFERAMSMGVKLIIFIIPEEDNCYKSVKRLGDLEYGIPTQCALAKNHSKFLHIAYLTNILLKINAKVNGINTILDVPWARKKIMFVGVDVTHPSPGDRHSVSVASCVGSYDNTFARYTAKLMAQERARHEIVNLDVLIEQILQTFLKENNFLPEFILIYRDGVSEGQFDQVMSFEVTKLKNLFERMNYDPKITYIVVQKRHNARFLPVRRQEASRSSNIPAGTTVDTIVTDSFKFDFYLCSHNGLLGTSRPSRYWVLYDQNNFSADVIQGITFSMCFLYPRCTRSVSIPTPVLYAHLSAYRARHHIVEVLEAQEEPPASEVLEDTVEEKTRKEQERRRRVNSILAVNSNISKSLYFI